MDDFNLRKASVSIDFPSQRLSADGFWACRVLDSLQCPN